MRLSQIKIAGFKSFVDPSKIMFPASVTAIVGPNGCGKSNVIDAVRWVMGESSARNLRGESMEDVIFSGSSGRQPVGQASVELVFDNSDGRVKGEYAKYNEISVKRIATRVGQSKYFLNNTRCRRRDIADIFLGTGLGPRSYSIIEQGMVSRIIDAKPDELRVYLEEAAGISKYKERRRETETRIRHTRENLDRLIDLIDEIDKQISRLDRQSKTAEKYKRLKQEQRRLEAESLLLQKQVFDLEIDSQKRKLTTVETGMEERTAALRETEREIEQGRQKLVEANEQHGQVQGQFYRLGADISSKQQTIEMQKNLRRHNRQELASLEQSIEEAGKILTTDGDRLAQLELQLASISPVATSCNSSSRRRTRRNTKCRNGRNSGTSSGESFTMFTRQPKSKTVVSSISSARFSTPISNACACNRNWTTSMRPPPCVKSVNSKLASPPVTKNTRPSWRRHKPAPMKFSNCVVAAKIQPTSWI